MSLRAKLATLFAMLAVLPLLAVGIFDYSRSLRAVEELILAQTGEIAQRAADDMASRYRLLEANVGLVAENSATLALYRGQRAGLRGDVRLTRQSRDYLAQLWSAVQGTIVSVSYRAPNGAELYRLADDDANTDPAFGQSEPHILTREVRDRGILLGRVRVAVRLDSVLPRSALASRFGRSGFSAVIDERGDSVVFATGRSGERARRLRAELEQYRPAGRMPQDSARREVSSFHVDDTDSTRVGTRVRLAAAPFSIVSASTLEEFTAPLDHIRNSNFIIVLAVTLAVAAAFALFLWRATHSLAELTVAADDVSRGNLRPSLPPAGRDEVGRLAGAFAYMLDRVSEMMREMERSRRVRAVGEFASQIAHEIRNPLTSIKLNLQKLDRARQRGALSSELERPVEISLTEIQRLDRVVGGVLRLGRRDSDVRDPLDAQTIVAEAIEIIRAQLAPLGVRVDANLAAAHDRVLGDPVLLQAAIVNLLMNAAESMPDGGSVYVLCENSSGDGRTALRCRVEDDGPGIPPQDREKIFDPFFTTKPRGTGLGLALAQRTMEEHQGRLWLDAPVRGKGAAFVLDFPLAGGGAT